MSWQYYGAVNFRYYLLLSHAAWAHNFGSAPERPRSRTSSAQEKWEVFSVIVLQKAFGQDESAQIFSSTMVSLCYISALCLINLVPIARAAFPAFAGVRFAGVDGSRVAKIV